MQAITKLICQIPKQRAIQAKADISNGDMRWHLDTLNHGLLIIKGTPHKLQNTASGANAKPL